MSLNYANEKLNIEKLYARFEGLIIAAATERRFIAAIGDKEDSIQEAGLAFMLAVRKYEQDNPCPFTHLNNECAFGDSKMREEMFYAEFSKFLKASICNHLCNVAKREIRYRKHTNVVFDEAYNIPCESIEEVLENRDKLLREDFYLTVLHEFFVTPQLMLDKAHLTAYESVVLCRLFHNKWTERKTAKQMNLSCAYINKLKGQGLAKLKKFLTALPQ